MEIMFVLFDVERHGLPSVNEAQKTSMKESLTPPYKDYHN